MRLAGVARFAVLVLSTGAVLGASCAQDLLSLMPGVVNDPQNLSLRRAIFSFGQASMCKEMQKRSLPLRLRDGEPAVGRFFPTACFAQELANGNMFIQFSGQGYAWTNLTKRIAFEASGAIEYEHDFRLHEGAMYVYFRQHATTSSSFKASFFEQPVPAMAASLAPGAGGYADAFGAQIMKNEMARGFTVIRDDDDTVQFGLGLIELGKRPPVPYRVEGGGRALQANERIEIHQNQRDYAGPFQVEGDDEALYVTANVEGAPAIDVMVVSKTSGDAWRDIYQRSAAPTAPTTLPIIDEPVSANVVWKRMVRVPAGFYYVVFDNTAGAGRTQPTTHAFDDRAAMVSFAVEVGDAP